MAEAVVTNQVYADVVSATTSVNAPSIVGALTGTASGNLPLTGGAITGSVSVSANLTLTGIPTADPHVVGRVWSNSGVLTVSAG